MIPVDFLKLSSASQKHGDTDMSAWDSCKVQKMMPHYHSFFSLLQPFSGAPSTQPLLLHSCFHALRCAFTSAPFTYHTGKLTPPHLTGIIFHPVLLLPVSPFTSFSNAACELLSSFQALKSASRPPPLLTKLSQNPNDPIPT